MIIDPQPSGQMQMSFWVEQVYVDSNPSPTAYPPALIFLSSNVKMSFLKKKKKQGTNAERNAPF